MREVDEPWLDDARYRRRMRRLAREFERMDRGRRARTTPGAVAGRLVTRSLVAVLTLLLLATLLVVDPKLMPAGLQEALGLGPGGRILAASPGSYKFLTIQPGTHDMPVTYDSCQTLHYVINVAGAPARFRDGRFIRDAVDEISQVSGLRFHYDGLSNLDYRTRNYQAGPILFSFNVLPDAPKYGDAVAIGGSDTLVRAGRKVYSTGAVTFRRDAFETIAGRPGGEIEAKAIALHELGHVLGLDHVQDENEIMYPSEGHTDDLGPGDRIGLRILGSGPCY